MVALTSVQLNYIIHRYFTESGFLHTAFMFDCEAKASKTSFDGDLIPPAALVTLVQKGLQYMEMEENLKKGENDVDEEFCFVPAMDLIKKAGYEEQKIETDKENQCPNRAPKSHRKGKLRNARKRGEARRKALEKEEAERDALDKEEAERKAREKEEAAREAREKAEADREAREKEEAAREAQEKAEADREAREKEEADRVERRVQSSRLKRKKLVYRIRN